MIEQSMNGRCHFSHPVRGCAYCRPLNELDVKKDVDSFIRRFLHSDTTYCTPKIYVVNYTFISYNDIGMNIIFGYAPSFLRSIQ